MRSAEEIVEFAMEMFGHACRRPLMYGNTAEGVDLYLHSHLRIWAIAHRRMKDFEAAQRERNEVNEMGAMGFSDFYRVQHPLSDEVDAARFVVEQWRHIADNLGAVVPWHFVDANALPDEWRWNE